MLADVVFLFQKEKDSKLCACKPYSSDILIPDFPCYPPNRTDSKQKHIINHSSFPNKKLAFVWKSVNSY